MLLFFLGFSKNWNCACDIDCDKYLDDATMTIGNPNISGAAKPLTPHAAPELCTECWGTGTAVYEISPPSGCPWAGREERMTCERCGGSGKEPADGIPWIEKHWNGGKNV